MFKRCPLNDPALLDRISRTQITGLFNKIKDLIKTHKDTAEFQELKNIIEREFFTKDVDVIGIAPKLEYDFIVNSNTKSSIECARELVLWISSDKIVSKHARQAGS